MKEQSKYVRYDAAVTKWCKKWGPFFLSISFAIIFIWYGALKIYGISPAEELVKKATNWIFSHEFVVFLGVWEILIGLCILFRPLRRLGIVLLFLQFPGTFMPLFTNPEDCFTIFPWGLTLEGQYIFKNLILISSALVLIGTLAPSKIHD